MASFDRALAGFIALLWDRGMPTIGETDRKKRFGSA
jgi:hypothetical protein